MYYIYTSWYYDTIIRTETGDRQGGYKDSKQTRTYVYIYIWKANGTMLMLSECLVVVRANIVIRI